jgi:SAM-dependent methyltransferase
MRRTNTPELLDSDTGSPRDIQASLQDLCRINRWFGGVATTYSMVQRVVAATEAKHLSLLEVAAGFGEGPRIAAKRLARRGVVLDFTLLDRAPSHLPTGSRGVVADALALPFADAAFDLVSCNLFAHHLDPPQLVDFVRDALRVSRRAVLINDLVRHPLHLALVYAAFPLMRTYVSRVDGVASVRRAYVPHEIRRILSSAFCCEKASRVEIYRHYLFRMAVIVWKDGLVRRQPAAEH